MDVETPSSSLPAKSPKKKLPMEIFVTWGPRVIALSSFVGLFFVLTLDPHFLLFSWIPGLARPLDLQAIQGTVQKEQFRISISGNQLQNEQLNSTNSSAIMPRRNEDYFIANTGIRGKKAVEQFEAHLDCWRYWRKLTESCYTNLNPEKGNGESVHSKTSDSLEGQWIYDRTPRKISWVAVPDNVHFFSRCDHLRRFSGIIYGEQADAIALSNDSNAVDNWSIRDELKWRWHTDETKCHWHPMDRDEFCRKVGSNRNILIVGDSISELVYNSVINAFAKINVSDESQWIHPGDELCTDVLGGHGKGFRVEFVRNDYLSLRSDMLWVDSARESPWMPILQDGKKDIKILLMNRGAHYQPDWHYTDGLRETFTFLRAWFPELIVIYRSTPSGHVNCSTYTKPIAEPVKGAPEKFHWEDFDRQNKLAKSIVHEFHYIYMDVAPAIGMRPEGHFISNDDCLHYCVPGPLDFMVEMFYNVLHLFLPN